MQDPSPRHRRLQAIDPSGRAVLPFVLYSQSEPPRHHEDHTWLSVALGRSFPRLFAGAGTRRPSLEENRPRLDQLGGGTSLETSVNFSHHLCKGRRLISPSNPANTTSTTPNPPHS